MYGKVSPQEVPAIEYKIKNLRQKTFNRFLAFAGVIGGTTVISESLKVSNHNTLPIAIGTLAIQSLISANLVLNTMRDGQELEDLQDVLPDVEEAEPDNLAEPSVQASSANVNIQAVAWPPKDKAA